MKKRKNVKYKVRMMCLFCNKGIVPERAKWITIGFSESEKKRLKIKDDIEQIFWAHKTCLKRNLPKAEWRKNRR